MTSTSASTSTKRPVVIFPRTTPTEQPVKHRVLLVDDDDAVRDVMGATLERKGFDVVAAANVAEALRLITTQSFDVLITDLHMPNPSDGFAVVTAMRHSQPDALTLLVIVSGYPDVLRSMAAVLLEADEVIVKPFEAGKLAELLRDKMLRRKPAARMEQERVGVLQSNLSSLDFSLLLPDVITIADEVDAQLTQTMDSYMNAARKAGAA